MITDAQLAELKERNRCDVVAATYVSLRRGGRKGMIGPCPICSEKRQSMRATKFEAWADGWACAGCSAGGDVIKLVMLAEGIEFTAAIERLGGTREIDAAKAAEGAARRQAAVEQAARDDNIYREGERKRVYEIWQRAAELHGDGIAGTPVEDYLRLRGIDRLPAGCRLRFLADYPYYLGGKRDADVIHRGPAMLAPIVDGAGKFRGLHTTWLDLTRPKGKADIRDPVSGDPLPAKKVRGSKAGHVIALARPAEPCVVMYIGEGLETVLSVWFALESRAARGLERAGFWSAVDLGNLGGKHDGSLAHPSFKTAGGRAQGVPGPKPDAAAAWLPIPASVRTLIILADADSDRFTVECAIARVAARSAERDVRVAWPPAGMDFNDVLLAGAAA